MPLFQATTQDRNDPTKYAGTKLTSPDVYAAANRPAIPGTLSPTSPSLSAIATGNLKALGNLGIDLYNRSLDIAVGDAGKSGQLSPFTLTPDENAAAQATGIMALPFGLAGKGGTTADVSTGGGAASKSFTGGGASLADDSQFALGERQLPATRGSLSGDPEAPPANASADQVRSIQRQNEAAQILADHGLEVEQLPNTGKGKNPDLEINGQKADVYSPTTKNPQTIWGNVKDKVAGQAANVVVNLADSPLSASEMAQFFQRNPVPGMNSVTLIKDGVVTILGR
jgi:filamentous hemagglutinin